ncbi:putative transposase, Ptta/En/Spm, plant [Helianthus annuus]|nr:putative transposase, Ptta/En/Spm, plant [Helianthus annuus]
MFQVTGKKSYARVREELKASKGQDPSRLEMFRACFSKDGTTKNLEASNAIVSNMLIYSYTYFFYVFLMLLKIHTLFL